MSTPYIVGGSHESVIYASGNVSWTALSRGTAVQNGDILVVELRCQSAIWTGDWTPPSGEGWVRVGPAFVGQNAAARVTSAFYKIVTNAGTEPSSYLFARGAGDDGGRRLARLFIVRGASAVVASNSHDPYGGYSISSGRRVTSRALPVGNGQPILDLFFGDSEFAAPNNHVPTTTPAGYSFVGGSAYPTSGDLGVSRTYSGCWSRVYDAGATAPNQDIQWTAASGAAVTSIALQGVEDSDPTGPGLRAHNGAGEPILVRYINAEGEPRTPSAMKFLAPGYSSVNDMLGYEEFFWAHRGGSASYPEHSLWAYTQSVARDFGALECSLGRTSDGQWFGLHDQDINRTSGLAAGTQPAASAMTWAAVQGFNITIGAKGAPRPYMALEELLNAYGRSHVLILDPKYSTGNATELMNKLQTFYGSDAEANEHIIMKAFGVGSTAFRNAVVARGYKTWGYFYDSNSADFAAHVGKWDLLGLNYECNQSYWDQLIGLANGKPIVAHICPSEAAVATGRSKGAVGFQCSGVGAIRPKHERRLP